MKSRRLLLWTIGFLSFALAVFMTGTLHAQSQPLSVTGPDIDVDPSSYDYGDVYLNSFEPKTFVVTNVGDENLDIANISIVGGGAGHFSIFSGGAPAILAPQTNKNVVVRFAPTTEDLKNAALRFISNDPDASEDTLYVPLTGTGVVAHIAVTPSPFDFEDVRRNTTDSQTFIISNVEGSGNLVVNQFGTSLTGDDASEFEIVSGGAPFIVVAGDTHHLVIEFTPTSLGPKSATLQIINNDPDSSVYLVNLSGVSVEPNIAVNPGSHDYGDVQVNYSALKDFYIKNTGTDDLYINDIGTTNTDFSLYGGKYLGKRSTEYLYIISPNDSQQVTVKFTPSSEEEKTGTMIFFSDDPDQPTFNVPLSGNGVIPDIAVVPESWDYDSVAVNTFEDKTFWILNTGTGNLDVNQMYIISGETVLGKVASPSSLSDFEIISGDEEFPFTVEPGDTHFVAVRFQPQSQGEKFAAMRIYTNDPDAEVENPFSVWLYGEGILEPEISVEPASGDFGNVVLGDDSTQTFVVYNNGSANLVINTLGTQLLGDNAGQFSITSGGAPFTIPPQNSWEIDVKFSPTTIGQKNATLRIESNDPDEELFNVPLTGVGVVADIAISPTFKNYGNVQVNESSSQIFIVTNLGSSNLVVGPGGTGLVGGDAAKFSITSGGAPFTLEPENSRQIVVSYSPNAEGADTTTFQIVSNDPDESPLNVTLTGEGVTTDINVTPSSANFGSVALGEAAYDTLRVNNLGTGTLSIPSNGTFFVGADADEFEIIAGGAPFTLAPNPNQFNDIVIRFIPETIGEKSAFLRILSSDTEEDTLDVPISATGIAEPDIALNTFSVDFESVLLGTADTLSILVSNEGTADLIININGTTLLGQDTDEFSIAGGGAPFTVEPEGSHEIKLRFAPTSAGLKSAQLRIDSNDPDQVEEELFVSLSGLGVGIPDISVSPASKDYGEVYVGDSVQQIFTISNTGTDALIIDTGDITIGGDNPGQFALVGLILPFTLQPAQSQNITVSFAPGSAGTMSATLQISSNDPDAVENPFNVPLTGTGLVEPDITVDPTSKNYGNVLVGNSSSQIFAVSNDGSDNLIVNVGGVTLGGANADQFSIISGDEAFTLAPEQSHEITVSFIPGATGAKSAVLQILSNDPDEGSTTVNLSGVGVDPVENAPGAPVNLAAAPNTWTNGSTFTLNWSNPSHPNKITGARYKYASAPTGPVDGTLVSQNFITQIVKSTDASLLGIKTWYVWLVDSLGNTSHQNASTVTTQFDNVAPATTSNAKTTYYTSDAAITLTPSDAHSGVDSTNYKINNGATQKGTSVTITTEGRNNTLEFWSTDAAGNVESHKLLSNIKIDKSKPSSLAGTPVSAGSGTYNVPVSASDAISGVASVELWYRWNGSSWLKYNGSFTTSPISFVAPFGAGTYDFEAVATDSAGLKEDRNGIVESSTFVTGIARNEGNAPDDYAIYQNYPNPFNPETTIEYALPKNEKVRITIFDVRGTLVRTLVDSEEQPQGYHQKVWNGRDDSGQIVGSGMYFYRIQAGSFNKTMKMLLVK
jgi:hypothetical protein